MARTPRSVQSESLLEAALEGLELRRKRLEDEIQNVRALLGRRGRGRPPKPSFEDSGQPAVARKRRLKPEARKRIAAAQKKRWAEYRKKQAASQKS